MKYEVIVKIGNFLVQFQEWVIALVIVSLVILGIMAFVAPEYMRQHAKGIIISYVIGLAVAFGAKPIGETLAGVFKVTEILKNFII